MKVFHTDKALSDSPSDNPQIGEVSDSPRNSVRIVILGGIVGNVIEWYDFALFGYFAPIISTQFFPNDGATVALLEVYGVFATGFIVRPLGAGVFGYIGDRVSRRTELFLSVVLMAIPTFLLGLLPTYGQVGLAAPIGLILLRLLQGLSVGGEFTGSVTYVAETVPQHRRGLATSFANVGSLMGMLLGLVFVTSMTHWLPASSLQRWGWRIPFLLGGALGLIGFYLRRSLHDSNVFQTHQEERQVPWLQALRQNLRAVVQATVYAGGYSAAFYLVLVYLPTYLEQFSTVPLGQALLLNTAGIVLLLGVIPLAGWLSDWLWRRQVWLLIGVLGLALSSYPAFWLLRQSPLMVVGGVQVGLALWMGLLMGVSPAMLVEQFPTNTRLTCYSLAFNLGVGAVGGTAPLVATWLINITRNLYSPALYLAGTVLVAAIALSFMGDRSREPLL